MSSMKVRLSGLCFALMMLGAAVGCDQGTTTNTQTPPPAATQRNKAMGDFMKSQAAEKAPAK